MKKTLILFMIFVMLFLVCGCTGENSSGISSDLSQSVAIESDEVKSDLETSNVEKTESDSSKEISQKQESTSNDPIIKIKTADEEQSNDKVNYNHYYDDTTDFLNYNLIIETSQDLKNFCVIELSEIEVLKIERVLQRYDVLDKETPLILHTYINDITTNRGISYEDHEGVIRYFTISISMMDGSVSLNEVKF